MGKSQPQTTAPKNWPAGIPYLYTPVYSPRLAKSQLQAIRTLPPDLNPTDIIPRASKPGPSANVRITAITDPRHPACGQCGLFAARDIQPGELIVPYLGEVHPGTTTETGGRGHEESDYDLWLDHDADVAVDAAKMGNEARFVNDYRGVPDAQRANAEFRAVWDERRGEKGMAVFALPASKRAVGKRGASVGIAKGREILVSYGKGFWGKRREETETWEEV